MGWSCTKLAGDTMDTLNEARDKKTGLYTIGGEEYFIDWSGREYLDGHITGTVYRVIKDGIDKGKAIKTDSLSINSNGLINYGPGWIKDLNRKTLNSSKKGRIYG